MSTEPKHWLIMANMDSELCEKAKSLRNHITEKGELPRKYRELIFFALSCGKRFEPGIKAHAEKALEHGATKGELFETMCLTILSDGFPAYMEGAKVFDQLLGDTQ